MARGQQLESDAYTTSDNIDGPITADFLPARVQKALSETERELIILEEETTRVQAMLDGLHARQRDVVAKIAHYRSLLAPVRKLPTELLSYIFVLCCPSGVTIPYALDEPQWILGRVSSKWRHVSLTTPQLWSTIHAQFHLMIRIRYKNPTAVRRSIYLASLDEVLRRSGGAALSLRITSAHYLVNALDSLMPHLSRIKKLHLDRSGRRLEAFLALPPGLVPSLCSLEITDNWDIDLNHSAVLQGAPNFHELLLAASQITPAWIYTLPLSQLTTLTLPYARFAPDQVLAIMKLSPNLIQCTFAVAAVAPINPRLSSSLVLAAPIVHNAQLLTFDLHSKCDEVYEIQQLFLPHLRHFILKSGRTLDWDKWWAPSILRSGLLETLVLDDIVVSSQQLGQLLHGTPHLSELGISSGRMITPPVLEKMASGALLPKLRTLRCLIGVTDVDDIGALDLHLDMLEKRREKTTAASHIADVQLKLMTSQRISGVTRLGRMVKEGWNIQHVWQ